MSRVADPNPPGNPDPGAGTATTGGPAPAIANARADDLVRSGLGDTASGGRLQDFDRALKDRPHEPE
jgi:hypothetical protein